MKLLLAIGLIIAIVHSKAPPEIPKVKTIQHAPIIYTNQLHAPTVYTHPPYAPFVYQSNFLPQIYANQPHFPITYKRKISPKAPVVYKSQEDPTLSRPGPPPVVPYNAAGNVCKNDAGQIVPCAHGVAPGSPNFYIGCGQNVMSGSMEEEILKIHNKRRFDLQQGILSQVQQDYLDDNRVPKQEYRYDIQRKLYFDDSNIPPIYWDSYLARKAQDWANQLACRSYGTIDHDENRGGMGENIGWVGAQSTDNLSEQDVADGVEAWWAEGRHIDYDDLRKYDDGLSSNGEVIGHFTQMAWAKTTKVGCGVSLQTTGGNAALITVCRYSPHGNVVGRPVIPL